MKRISMLLMSLLLVFCISGCSDSIPSVYEPSGGITISDISSEQTDSSDRNSQANSTTNTPSESNSEPTDSSMESASSEQNDGNSDLQTNSETKKSSENIIDTSNPETDSDKKILVAFFSRTGENYGVGVIEKGNTHIIADMIAEETDADSFEIVRVTPYPETYRECTDEAQTEKSANARPELTAAVENFDDYDVIFLGYPNWWGDMPMPVYTFIESYDFSGKVVIPFCTHAGSGLSSTVQTLRNKLSDSTVLEGLAITGTTAQNNQDEAKQSVLTWLDEIDMID